MILVVVEYPTKDSLRTKIHLASGARKLSRFFLNAKEGAAARAYITLSTLQYCLKLLATSAPTSLLQQASLRLETGSSPCTLQEIGEKVAQNYFGPYRSNRIEQHRSCWALGAPGGVPRFSRYCGSLLIPSAIPTPASRNGWA